LPVVLYGCDMFGEHEVQVSKIIQESEKYQGDSLGYCIMYFAIYVGHLLLPEKWTYGMETRNMVW